MSLKTDDSLAADLAESLLQSTSEVTESLLSIEIERESFTAIACYLYRATFAVMELQASENAPPNALPIVQSISKKIDFAKGLVCRCQRDTNPIKDHELRSVIVQLESVINHIGEDLSMIPASTYGDQDFAALAVKSLSLEMKKAQLEVGDQSDAQLPKEAVTMERQSKRVSSETDLYSIDTAALVDNSRFLSGLQFVEFLQSTSTSGSHMKQRSASWASITSSQVAEAIEPIYGTFFCPLTKKIMEDPVTIESGVTYERGAIDEWLKKHENTEQICCPVTGKKLVSQVLSANFSLKTTIEEWKERNEAARIKVARAALSLASSPEMVLEALKDVQSICQHRSYNKIQVRNIGMIPLLAKFMEYKDRNVRCMALDILRQLAEEDEDNKEMIARVVDMAVLINLLSSSHQPTRHSALQFLLELSESQSLCESIGSATGAILILITNKYNSLDAFACEKASEILRNLERHPSNIKIMAENGYVEPLLEHLIEGSEELKLEMASYLEEIFLGYDSQNYVAVRAAPSLISMVQSGHGLIRRAAFKALARISSYHPNSKLLVEAGILQIMIEEMFNRQITDETMNSRVEAASIITNIVDSGLDLEKLQVNVHGHTMASDYIVYNLISMMTNSTPDELNINLVKILLCLTKSPKSTATIVSVVKETEASYVLIELINNPHEEFVVVAIQLLIILSSYMGHTLCERLCKTRGLPENLIRSPNELNHVTEKQSISAKFLAKLPHKNVTLNLALLHKGLIADVLQRINRMQVSSTRTGRYAIAYLEGLVGILVRFTTTLYEPQLLVLARNYNFTSVFTELLMRTSSDEVQRLSAIGLENLSAESAHLSKPPEIKKTKIRKLFHLPKYLSFNSSKKKKLSMCPVHRGACSSQSTFCLIEANAVERLLTCLEHENVEVVEAALSALCTLLDDKVDVDKSVDMLSSANTIQHVLNVVKDHRHEGLRQKSFWVIEKFLSKGGNTSASYISQDRLLPSTLVSAFHHGDVTTRQMAERILRHLNKMPYCTTSFYTM
ncbi:putative U-box domain-containing protein 42 [Rhodamnia argentea]|uniref:RING-type E3 ubiquitin transferase n=1 Tax=Rhodamnia argentea TaxID=178133 RepID=A0A8B8QQX7_9MYRT|nr:putative U-box domain-containing protein 42 [Rhodamnia argentea]